MAWRLGRLAIPKGLRMSKTKGVLYGLGIIAVIVAGWLVLHRRNIRTDAQTGSQTLPAQDKAKYVIDEKHHTITTISRVGKSNAVVRRTFLAPNASITVRKDGSVVVDARSWGTEVTPFIGTTFDSEFHIRTTLGVNGFYWQRWEFGGGLSIRASDLDPRVFVGVSYNVYSNILLTAAIDNHKAVSVGVALKF